jgi:hypothetical protein
MSAAAPISAFRGEARCQTAPSPGRSTPTSYRATSSITPDKAVGARTRRDHDRTRNDYRRDWRHHDSTSIGDAASVGSAMEAGSASASGTGAAEACDGKECCKEQSSHVSLRCLIRQGDPVQVRWCASDGLRQRPNERPWGGRAKAVPSERRTALSRRGRCGLIK